MGARAPCPCLTQPKAGRLSPPRVLRKKNSNGVPPRGQEFEVRGPCVVREGRRLPAQWSQTIRGGTSYIKGNISRSGERILPFQQAYPRGSHELLSTFIMRQAAGA